MPAGRPSKYDPAFCDKAEEVLGEGYSETVLAGDLGVCPDTITEWKKEHPEFSLSVKIGRARGVRIWEDRLRVSATSGEGNTTAVIFGLKNRAAAEWRDKTEQELSGSLKIDAIKRVIVDPAHD